MKIHLSEIINSTEFQGSLLIILITAIYHFLHKNQHKIFQNIRKIKLIVFPIKFNVALVFNNKTGEKIDTYSDAVIEKFKSLIVENNLQRDISLINISEIIKFESKKEAEDFTQLKNLDLLIWGGFSSDNLQHDGEGVTYLNLNFTYRHSDDEKKQIQKVLESDISSKLAVKNYWKIVSKNSYDDVQIVSDNLFDVAMYILAISLKFTGKIHKSLQILKLFHSKLIKKNDDLAQAVVKHILDCYEILIIDYGVNKKKYKIGEEYSREYLSYKPDSLFGLVYLALFQYRNGNRTGTEDIVKRLHHLYPNSSATKVDVAFIRIIQKNYDAAYKHYNDLIKLKHLEFNVQEVVEFLFEEYEASGEIALLYGAGILSFYFADKSLAHDTLSEFYERAKSDEYAKMRLKVSRLLSIR